MKRILLLLLLALPMSAFADTCTKMAAAPDISSVPDGNAVSIYCDNNGNLYTKSSLGTGGVVQANQGTPGASPWPVSGNVGIIPAGTPLSASTTGVSTGDLTATLSGTSGKKTYINGFSITCATAASPVSTTVNITGTITGNESYTFTQVTGFAPLTRTFSQPLPATAVNTAIVVTLVGVVGGSTCAVNAEGFQL